ncbi:hypothetical protein BJ138DRAFT_1134268 [Hygrophoropsis aurantiaca]|uniref:Uncharacterized protein n=1 Tax=Hygrophoropsis aurantiaca TaxID=72124 RepID=A0ACB8AJP0_9AGAM|nr:hypothetical protein BJ138DRAFT_1134268 [Hygrophoropsis aurantiaca]
MPVRRSASNNGGGFQLGFFGMVAAVMAALKLKERWDDYQAVSTDEGRVALHSPNGSAIFDEENEIGLNSTNSNGFLNTEIPGAVRPKRKRDKGCCMCCGINCGLFWKAVGIVLALTIGWNAFKLIKWAITPSLTGLEDMPEYSTSLGCMSAPHYYMGAKTNFTVPLGAQFDHSLNIQGSALGTLVLAEGASDATDIVYEISLRRDDRDSFGDISIGTLGSGKFHIQTPTIPSPPSCMRFDVTAYIPRQLKKLDLVSYSTVQLKFTAEGTIVLDELSIQLLGGRDQLSMLLPSSHIQATHLSLQLARGWLVGDIAASDKTNIDTQKGDGVVNLHITPVASSNPQTPTTAQLDTITGGGRTDLYYVSDRSQPHRPIMNTHTSERGGDLYITYKEAEFNGRVELKAKSSTSVGVQGALHQTPGQDSSELPWVGNADGGDSVKVSSPRGWVGLYF